MAYRENLSSTTMSALSATYPGCVSLGWVAPNRFPNWPDALLIKDEHFLATYVGVTNQG